MKENLVKLAKGKKMPAKVGKPTNPQDKKSKDVPVEKPKTPEEERDIKAKLTVKKLLEDVDLSGPQKEELLEIDTPKKEGIEWLEEQVTLLSEENERLKIESETAKEDYNKLFQQLQNKKIGGSNEFENETIAQNIILLFNELQNNLLGNNKERTPWKMADIRILLNQMVSFFPFVAKYRKF